MMTPLFELVESIFISFRMDKHRSIFSIFDKPFDAKLIGELFCMSPEEDSLDVASDVDVFC